MVKSKFCYVVVDSLNLRVFSQNDCIISLLFDVEFNMVFDTCKGVMCHNIMEYNIMFGYTIPQRDRLHNTPYAKGTHFFIWKNFPNKHIPTQ